MVSAKFQRRILKLSRHLPAIVITGARQTGKTSLLRELFPNHSYVSLDAPSIAEEAEMDPESFYGDILPSAGGRSSIRTAYLSAFENRH